MPKKSFSFFKKQNTTPKKRRQRRFFVHPLFFLVGVWFCLIGKLPLFLISTLVALQHECAHAFAAAKLGYRLNKIVLMPYGAAIDGDVSNLTFKDAATVALAGPMANLLTACAFVALWWLYPTAYAFTDVACYASLSIAAVNLLPAYPLDGGRILKNVLLALSRNPDRRASEKRADKLCRGLTLLFSAVFLTLFFIFLAQKRTNFTLLLFGIFLLASGVSRGGNYEKLNVSFRSAFARGAEIRRVAILSACPLKKALTFLSPDRFLILDVYDEAERYIGEIPQTRLAEFFERSTVYTPIGDALLPDNGQETSIA